MKFESNLNQLEIMESHVSESIQIAIFFACFGIKCETPYRAVITALQTMTNEELSWDRATARLLQEYLARNADNRKPIAESSSETCFQQTALKSKPTSSATVAGSTVTTRKNVDRYLEVKPRQAINLTLTGK